MCSVPPDYRAALEALEETIIEAEGKDGLETDALVERLMSRAGPGESDEMYIK